MRELGLKYSNGKHFIKGKTFEKCLMENLTLNLFLRDNKQVIMLTY